jgi:hypothetical protein
MNQSVPDTDSPLSSTRASKKEGPRRPEFPAQEAGVSLDANNRVDKALRLLTRALRPLIEKELRRVHVANWQQHISFAQGSDRNKPLDAYAALKTMIDNWQICFKDIMNNKTRTDVSRAFEARIAIAHATDDEIPAADAISYLTAIRDIAVAISADDIVDILKAFVVDQIKAAAGAGSHEPLIKPGKEW